MRWRFTQPDMGELPTVGAGVCNISVDVRVHECTQLHFCLCLYASSAVQEEDPSYAMPRGREGKGSLIVWVGGGVAKTGGTILCS